MEWKGGQGEHGRHRHDGVKDHYSVFAVLGDLRALAHRAGARKRLISGMSAPDPGSFLLSSSRKEGNNGCWACLVLFSLSILNSGSLK